MVSDYDDAATYAEAFDKHAEFTGYISKDTSPYYEFRSICADADKEITALRAKLDEAQEDANRNCREAKKIARTACDLNEQCKQLRSLALRQHEMLEGMEEDGNGECLVCGQPSDRHHAGMRVRRDPGRRAQNLGGGGVMAIAECKHCKEDFIQFDSSPKDGVCRRPECRTKETIAALRAQLTEAERENRRLKGELESSIRAEDSEREIAVNHARQTDTATARVAKLEEALEDITNKNTLRHADGSVLSVGLFGEIAQDALAALDAPKVDPKVQAIRDAVAQDEALLEKFELVDGGRMKADAPKEQG